MSLLYFHRVDSTEHENRTQFRFGVNPFILGGFKIGKMTYWKKIPVVQIEHS